MEDVSDMICFATKAVAAVAAASRLAGEDDTAVLHIPMVVMICFATKAVAAASRLAGADDTAVLHIPRVVMICFAIKTVCPLFPF